METRCATERGFRRPDQCPSRDAGAARRSSSLNKARLLSCRRRRRVRLQTLRILWPKCTSPSSLPEFRPRGLRHSQKRGKAESFSFRSTEFLGDVDPLSGPRRFKSGFDNTNRFSPIGAINQRRSSRRNRVEKGDQLRPQRFFWRKLELMDRAFHCFDSAVTGDVPVFERFNFVLGNVVIADGGRIFPDDRQLAHFSRQMLSLFDRRQNRTSVASVVLHNNERLVLPFVRESNKTSHHRIDTSRRSPQQKLKQDDKVDDVFKNDAAVPARPLEAAEIRAQHFDLPETPFR